MQPELALVYNPQSGNGMVGMGWQLTGIPYISRVNYGSGINYDANDTYAHSVLGILVKQSDGSYRTKKESFAKFVPSGACLGGPCSWTMTDRSGLTHYYGTGADSRLDVQSVTRAWGLSSIVDLFGSSYSIKYAAYIPYYSNNVATHLYPDLITYTQGPGLAASRQVKFEYEARTDKDYYQGAWSGSYYVNNPASGRLKWITVDSGGQLIRKYRLDYECGDGVPANCSGTQTGRSRLKAVTEIGSDGVSTLPPQTFTWEQGGSGFAQYQSLAPATLYYSQLTFAADFTGDGRTDIVTPDGGDATQNNYFVSVANGSGFTKQVWSSPNRWASATHWGVGDFDGNGKADFATVNGGIIYVNLSTGYGFVQQGWPAANNWGAASYTWVGDFDGDGRADFASANGGNVYMNLSTGSGFVSQTWPVTNNWGPAEWTRIGDFNGDGRTDIASRNGMDIYLKYSTGAGFTEWHEHTAGNWGEAGYTFTGDFDGDGDTDIASAIGGTIYVYLSKVPYASNGLTVPNNWGAASYTWAGDFNGDGKTDIATAIGGNIYVNLSTGYSFIQQLWTVPSNWGAGDFTRAADFTGDGKADIASLMNGSTYLDVAMGASPDLVRNVKNGLGGTIDVGYASAPTLLGAIQPSSTGPGIPNTSPQLLVTMIITNDGRGGRYQAGYAYQDSRVLPGTIPNRRNLGFTSVQVFDARPLQYGEVSTSTITYYNQTPGKEGTAASVEDWAGSVLVKEKLHSYEVVSPPGTTGIELVRETQETLRVYELGSFAFSQWTTTSYDDYGNPTIKAQYADGLPTVTITTKFENDATNWILGRIRRITTTSGATTLGDVQNIWSGNTIKEKWEWLDTTNSWLITKMEYDAYGNVFLVTEPDAGDTLTRTTKTEFDATFRAYPAKVTNALGQITEKTYYADGNVKTLKDVNGQVVTITYDVFGRKRTESGPGSQYTEYEYRNYGDPNRQCNRVAKWVDATRSLWKEEYFDGTGFKYGITSSGDCASVWVVVDHQKDAAGRPYRTSQPYCYGGTPVWTRTDYDAAGRVASITTPDAKVTQYGHTTAYSSVTDANGQVTKKYFDARNKTKSVVDAAGQTTSYGYDPLGRLTSIIAPGGGMTRIWYDSLNRRTRVEEPQVAPTEYTYYGYGNLKILVTRGKTVTFSYDALNRVTLKQPASETEVRYVYDEPAFTNGKGRVTTIVDASGTTHFSYAPSGQIAMYSRHIDGKDFSQHFTYDRADRVTQITYPNGYRADYTYTDGGGLSTLKLDGADTGIRDIATWTDYDASGKPWTVNYGNGVGTTYQYDAMGHLTHLSTMRGAAVLQDLTYDWYGRPNTGGLNVGSITDNRVNVNKLCSDGSNTDETQAYTYDSLYRLTQADGVWGSKPYAYSSIGNPITFGGLTTRTLNFIGQQVMSGTGLSQVEYDPSTGNMTHKKLDGVESTYDWTAEGRLSTIKKGNLVVAQMTYDAEGQRAKKVSSPSRNGTDTTTTYIGAMYEKRTYSDASPERHTMHLFGNGQLVASVTKTGNILTASNDVNEWRAEWALGAMYDPTSPAGAGKKLFHVLRALGAHPATARWLGGTLFAAAAAWLVFTLFLSFRRRGFTRAISPALRLASLGIVLAFGFTACTSGPGDRRSASQPILNGDMLLGPPPGTYFYHRNQINSSSVITDYLGNEATRYAYLPFGEVVRQNSCGTDTVTAKFTGQEYDDETSLYYYGARYYDPAIGRFLSPDTVLPSLTDGQTLNRYSYVRNNPIVYVDPTGHFLDFIGDVISATANAVHYVAQAVERAANWIAETAREAGDFIGKAAQATWAQMKAFGSDPRSLAVFVIALGICIATMNAPAIVIIMQMAGSMLGAMAAQSIAVAAGVTNPTVLSIIGIAGGVLGGGGGLAQLLKAGAAFGISYGLGRAEAAIFGDTVATYLAPLNALAGVLIVNGLAKKFGSTPAADEPKDPNANASTHEQMAGSGAGEVGEARIVKEVSPSQRLQNKLFIAGAFMWVGKEVTKVGIEILVATGATGWGAAAGLVVMLIGIGLVAGGGVYGAIAVRDAYNGNPRRRRRRRHRQSVSKTRWRACCNIPENLASGCPA